MHGAALHVNCMLERRQFKCEHTAQLWKVHMGKREINSNLNICWRCAAIANGFEAEEFQYCGGLGVREGGTGRTDNVNMQTKCNYIFLQMSE